MTDEPTSSEVERTEPRIESEMPPQTTNELDGTERREEKSKQPDEPQPMEDEVDHNSEQEQQVEQEEEASSESTQAAVTADDMEKAKDVSTAVEKVETAAVSEQHTSTTQAADNSREPQVDSEQESQTASETQIEASTADSTSEANTPLPTSHTEAADNQHIDTAATHTSLDTSTDSELQQHSSSQPPATETDSSDTDTHTASDPADLETDSSESSTQLVATLPSPSVPLPPTQQPAVVPRESAIQVRLLLASADELVLVTVHIAREYLSQPKPFLGGYRHHLSGRVKHHAAVQTERRHSGKGGGRERVSRDTQTIETATRSAQSGRSVGTQMARKDYYIGEEGETGQGERVVVAGEYVSSQVLEAQREERAKQIQCWLRVCFAVRRMKQLKAAKEQTESSSRRATEVAADRKRREEEQQIQRRMHPKSKEDFTLLYGELNAWRQHEAARIHTLEVSDEERDKQLSMLLSKEVKLLQTIDRLKIRASKERKEEAIHRRLEMMQSPKEWTTSAGHHVEVVTPYTVRAQELTSLYQALLLPVQMHAEEKEMEAAGSSSSGYLTWDGRVDVLLHCKYVVGEMASQLSADILELIEREQEWVRRRHNTPGWQADQALAGMRKRLAALFLQFVQTPAYNPEAAVYVDSVGRDGKQRMQELLKKPLAEREVRKRRPTEEGQDRFLTARLQT